MTIVQFVSLAIPLLILAALSLTFPLWQGPLRKWLATRRLFLAAVEENSALGRQRGDKLDLMYINPGPTNRHAMQALAQTYNRNDYAPIRVLPPEDDGIVWIGIPYYATVKKWYLSKVHEEVLHDEDRHGTIPLKVRTIHFPAAPDGEAKNRLTQRIAEARTDPTKRLSESELEYVLALGHPQSGEGYEYAHGVSVDYEFRDPWAFRNNVEYIGEQMYEFLNQAVRLAGAHLRFLAVELNPSGALEAEITRKVEPCIQALLGLREWEEQFSQDGLRPLLIDIDVKDGSGNMTSPTRTTRVSMKPVEVLELYGVRLLRIRVRDLTLPEPVLDLLRKPVEARAEASAALIAADMRVRVAGKDAVALVKKGEGEQGYAELVAKGDQARISAWNPNNEQTPPEAIQARLQQRSVEAWEKGVSSPGEGKVVVVGAPGTSTDPITGAVAALTSVVKQIGGSGVDKPKEHSPAPPDEAAKPEDGTAGPTQAAAEP